MFTKAGGRECGAHALLNGIPETANLKSAVPGNIRAGARAGRSTKQPQKRMMQASMQGMEILGFRAYSEQV